MTKMYKTSKRERRQQTCIGYNKRCSNELHYAYAKVTWGKDHILLRFPSSEIPLGQTSKQYTTSVVQRTSTKLAGKQKRDHEQQYQYAKLFHMHFIATRGETSPS